MFNVYLQRILQNDKQTLGRVQAFIPYLFLCKTLELPWVNNLTDVSCIEAGEYICKWTRSNRLSRLAGHDVYTYELFGVKGRSGIRIHSANYFFQLKGCIAFGDNHKDINIDGQLDVVHSGKTVSDFNERMNKQDFRLIITDIAA